MIGNYRMGLKRHVVHLGDSPSIEEYSDLTTLDPSTVPFFPPLPSDFDKPDRISMVTSDGGFKDYMKSKNAAVGSPYSALQATELTGRKIIIWDGGDSKFLRHVDTSKYPISTDDSKNVTITDIETALNGASSKGGLADFAAVLGTFLPTEKQYQIINIPGRTIYTLDDTGLHIKQYTVDFVTLVSSITMLHATGDIMLTAGTTAITVAKDGTATLNANGSKIEVLTAGIINIDAGTNQVNIDASKVDVTVSGTMDVN
jgi:hypothetical protein